MSDYKQKSKNYSLIILVVILLAAILASFWFFRVFRPSIESASVSISKEFKTINREVVTNLKELRVCGNWPLNTVNRSQERGNPFTRKNSDKPLMVATSTPECLPVSQ